MNRPLSFTGYCCSANDGSGTIIKFRFLPPGMAHEDFMAKHSRRRQCRTCHGEQAEDLPDYNNRHEDEKNNSPCGAES